MGCIVLDMGMVDMVMVQMPTLLKDKQTTVTMAIIERLLVSMARLSTLLTSSTSHHGEATPPITLTIRNMATQSPNNLVTIEAMVPNQETTLTKTGTITW